VHSITKIKKIDIEKMYHLFTTTKKLRAIWFNRPNHEWWC